MLPTRELEYELPHTLVATTPAAPRDSARLMVVRRRDDGLVEHRTVRELPDLLAPGDMLVTNRTRVLPARLLGRRLDSGAAIEGLYLHQHEPGVWSLMLRGKRLEPGLRIELGPPDSPVATLELLARADDGSHRARVESALAEQAASPEAILDRVGLTPLPPYILRARKDAGAAIPDADDRAWYQTVYAQAGGSVAAPTAGLHLTPEVFARLAERRVERAEVILHVGVGTFRPVDADHVEEHPMHEESCSLAGAAPAIDAARARGGRVIAVGTTTARTLEAFASHPAPAPEWIRTRLLITPGHAWRGVDALLTNFHLPRSTLMALVASLLEGGAPRLRRLYAQAIEARYRFYSYGDAMLILP